MISVIWNPIYLIEILNVTKELRNPENFKTDFLLFD